MDRRGSPTAAVVDDRTQRPQRLDGRRHGRLREAASPSNLLDRVRVWQRAGQIITVPAALDSAAGLLIRRRAPVLRQAGARVTSQSSPALSMPAPSACSTAAISAVSRAQRERSLDGRQ
jgi:hypothetical protein